MQSTKYWTKVRVIGTLIKPGSHILHMTYVSKYLNDKLSMG